MATERAILRLAKESGELTIPATNPLKLVETKFPSHVALLRLLTGKEIPLPTSLYESIRRSESTNNKANTVLYIGAHPGDGPDFIYSVLSAIDQNIKVHELLLTDGEMGWTKGPEETRKIRRLETIGGIQSLGRDIQLSYLQYPDGRLLENQNTLRQLIEDVKKQIKILKPEIIITHPPELDHPDHIAAYIAIVSALIEIKEEKMESGEEYSPPALYITDPEFGFASGGQWAIDMVTNIFPWYPRETTFVIPDLIFNADSNIELQLQSLLNHKTQMNPEKSYWEKIPGLWVERGRLIRQRAGIGLRQVGLGAYSSSDNLLASCLPDGSLFKKSERSLRR